MKKNKWIYISAIAVLVVVLAVVGGLYWFSANNYIGKVAGEKITEAEYKVFLSQVKYQMESEAKVTDDKSREDFWKSTIDGKNAQDVAKAKALDSVKAFKIQVIKAKESGAVLDKTDWSKVDTDLDSSYNDYKSQSGSTETKDQFFLSQTGVKRAQFRTVYGEYTLISKYVQAEKKKINVTDEEIKKQYDDNVKNYSDVTVRHILVFTIDSDGKALSEEKKAVAKTKAEDILAKVKAGNDMKALVKEFSDDPPAKQEGSAPENEGLYSFDNYNTSLVKEFKDWGMKAEVGASDIVETSYGYHVMKLEKRTPKAFDDIKATIKGELVNTKFDEKYAKDLDVWKADKKYNVITNDKYNAIKVIE